jgi:DNA-binding LytR/AlgR family response regulator
MNNLKQITMNCIIVDDDKLSRTTLRKMISKERSLKLTAECANAQEAFDHLQKEPCDLVFLDVEMPGMSGIELIKNLVQRPAIILITGKKDYAVEAFELNVADYIMKPVSAERLSKAVEKAQQLTLSKRSDEINEKSMEYIFVRSNAILTRIKLKDIVYIQGVGEYVNINTTNDCNTIQCSLKKMEEQLPSEKFYRLHRSYLVAIDHIDAVEDNIVYSGKHLLPVGEQYRQALLKKLNLSDNGHLAEVHH